MNENDIQRSVFLHLRTRGAPGIIAFHPKNGGIHQRGRHRGINAGLGVLSGASDVIVIAPPHGRVYALELKAEGKKPTKVQQDFMNAIFLAGGMATWSDNLDEALKILEGWGLLRGRLA
jgi:hypothetical protein